MQGETGPQILIMADTTVKDDISRNIMGTVTANVTAKKIISYTEINNIEKQLSEVLKQELTPWMLWILSPNADQKKSGEF